MESSSPKRHCISKYDDGGVVGVDDFNCLEFSPTTPSRYFSGIGTDSPIDGNIYIFMKKTSNVMNLLLTYVLPIRPK